MRGLTAIPRIRVGHASDFEAATGCTVILVDGGAVGGVDVRGSASGTAELPAMDPLHVTSHIHGVVLTGGSAFGLEAACGVRQYLEQQGIGFETSAARVPLVPCAVLYDLAIGRAEVRPTQAMGAAAAAAATRDPVEEGSIGAGTGATVGKMLGMACAMKGGVGSATVTLPGGVLVSSLVVVNALGDVRDPHTGALVAGTRRARDSRELANSADLMKQGVPAGFKGSHTTLAVVATNARLDKVRATKLAQLAHLGMAHAIHPVNTMSDGDVVFALSAGDYEARIDALGVAAAEAVAEGIVRAVRKAKSLGGVVGLG